MRPLGERERTGPAPGATRPDRAVWDRPPGRSSEHRVLLPEADWTATVDAVLSWAVKTRSGFAVDASTPPVEGQRLWITALGVVREPVEVTQVVDQPDRQGFAYTTLTGHPVRGEESFVVDRDEAGAVHLTIRTVTRSGTGLWWLLFPITVVGQRVAHRSYRKALLLA